ncbi:MAG TPA: hypothetical protein VJZ27_03905 [Aggregatilineales bacterium]|nr:hypothetical protein [Aggregatilineales bacterium]
MSILAKIALIQNLFQTLKADSPDRLTGFAKQVYEKFFEVLVDESGHEVLRAESLDEYLKQGYGKPDIVICTPFQEIGNLAPGFAELGRILKAFEGVPVIVWSNRDEAVIRVTVLEDQGATEYYTGTLLNAPDDFADMVLKYTT